LLGAGKILINDRPVETYFASGTAHADPAAAGRANARGNMTSAPFQAVDGRLAGAVRHGRRR
jgi:hypothetical protein